MAFVRPALVSDAEPIARVHVRSWQQAYRGMVPDDYLDALSPTGRAQRLREMLSVEDGPFRTLVVCPDDNGQAGEARGFAHIGPYREQGSEEIDDKVGEVLAIYVDPAWQGQGAGRALMDAAVAWQAARGRDEVRLWVLDANWKARRFYERYGFVADGATSMFGLDAGEGRVELPEVRYALRRS